MRIRRGARLFFFSSRRRHTRFDCDWSSDVCSSDLTPCASVKATSCTKARRSAALNATPSASRYVAPHAKGWSPTTARKRMRTDRSEREIGRASCRERVQDSVVVASLKKQEATQEAG